MEKNMSKCFEENKCFTFLSKRQLIDEGNLLAIGIVSLTLIPFAVVSNSVLLVHFSKNRFFPNNFRSLLKILAVADFLVGVVVLPLFSVILIFHAGSCNCQLELICQFAAALFAGTSGRTTGIIAVDRYIHIKYSHYYPLLLTPRCKAIVYSFSIVMSVCVAVSTTLGTIFGKYPLICGTITAFDISVLGSVVFLYLSAWKSVNRHVRTSAVWSSLSRRPKYNLVLAKKVTCILIVLNICYGPFVITNFLRSFFDDYFPGPSLTLLNLWSYNIVFANSVLNAVVLLHKDSRLRKSTPFNERVDVRPVIPTHHSSRERKLTGQRSSGLAIKKCSEKHSRSVAFDKQLTMPVGEVAVLNGLKSLNQARF